MKIAFIHYHLNRGGVTTVIRQQAKALESLGWEVLVLSGQGVESSFPAPVVTIPELAYDHLHPDSNSPVIIANKIISAIDGHWPEGVDLVHVHNPTLAKNRHLQGALKILQDTGIRLLCQIHDFAEDGRPAALYPSGYVENCHYATVNPRDYQLLIDAGLQPEGCHLLPNEISAIQGMDEPEATGDYVLYPVRAIRRKNLGEALLISHFLEPGTQLKITLPPNSPADVETYEQWRDFARQHRLPVTFEAGIGADFSSLMAGCKWVLTTSITEGFGFAFLEPWTAGKAIWGRLLPEICSGYIDKGVELNHLYKHLWVDLSWLDTLSLEREWKTRMEKAAKHLGMALPADGQDRSWNRITEGGTIDFGLLSERFQQQILVKVTKEPDISDGIKRLNPWLNQPGPSERVESVIDQNAATIKALFSPHQYARRLNEIYPSVASHGLNHAIDKSILASFFLKDVNFSLLKWGQS